MPNDGCKIAETIDAMLAECDCRKSPLSPLVDGSHMIDVSTLVDRHTQAPSVPNEPQRMLSVLLHVGLLTVTEIGGMCPMEARGTIGRRQFWHFRASGQRYTIEVADQPVRVEKDCPAVGIDIPGWKFEGEYIEPGFDASYMPRDVAERLIVAAFALFGKKGEAWKLVIPQ